MAEEQAPEETLEEGTDQDAPEEQAGPPADPGPPAPDPCPRAKVVLLPGWRPLLIWQHC